MIRPLHVANIWLCGAGCMLLALIAVAQWGGGMSSFSIPWSDAQQERLADLVADGHELPEIMRRMPGHPQARLRRKIAEILEDAAHLADAAPGQAGARPTPAGPGPVVREHDAAPVHPEIPGEERSGTAREAPGTLEGRDPPPPLVGAGVDVGVQPAAPQHQEAGGIQPASHPGPTRFAITLDARARDLLDAMAAATDKRPARLAAELLAAVLEDDAAAHRDSEAAPGREPAPDLMRGGRL